MVPTMVLLTLLLLPSMEARPQPREGGGMATTTLREARRHLRLATIVERQLRLAVMALEDGTKPLQRRARESRAQEQRDEQKAAKKRRVPFAPWAGR